HLYISQGVGGVWALHSLTHTHLVPGSYSISLVDPHSPCPSLRGYEPFCALTGIEVFHESSFSGPTLACTPFCFRLLTKSILLLVIVTHDPYPRHYHYHPLYSFPLRNLLQMAILDIQVRQDSAWRTLTSHNFPVLSKKTWSDWVWHTHTALKSGGVFQAVLGIDPATGQHYAPPHQNAALPFYDQAANDAWTSAMTSVADWIAQAAGPKHANEVARFLNRNDPR
ncbi:hypothetical protein CPB86DRAFT_855460, partial [Serendipita vermifera]